MCLYQGSREVGRTAAMSWITGVLGVLCLTACTGWCMAMDMCQDFEPRVLNTSGTLTLTAPTPASGAECRCVLNSGPLPMSVRYTTTLTPGEGRPDTECGPALRVETDTLGYTVCSDASSTVDRTLASHLAFHLRDADKMLQLTVMLEVLEGTVEVTCEKLMGMEQDICLCTHQQQETWTPRPVIGDIPVKNRVIAGVVATVVFLVLFAVVLVIYKYWKKRTKDNANTPSTAVTQAASNPGFTNNEHGSQSFLYDEIDPVTGHTRIRFEPDASLNLAPDPSYATIGEPTQKGSRDLGLYGRDNAAGDIEEISPYASTVSTLQRGGSQPALAGFGDVDPVYPGYTVSYTQTSTLPSGFTTQTRFVYPPPSYSDLDIKIPLSAAEIESMYAKPMKKSLRENNSQSSSAARSMSQQDAGSELDIAIPANISDRLNESAASVETEV